jgi:hypothetical protein
VQPKTSREEWQKRVERWRDSGLTAEQFAGELGINAGTLKFWATSSARRAGKLRQLLGPPDQVTAG